MLNYENLVNYLSFFQFGRRWNYVAWRLTNPLLLLGCMYGRSIKYFPLAHSQNAVFLSLHSKLTFMKNFGKHRIKKNKFIVLYRKHRKKRKHRISLDETRYLFQIFRIYAWEQREIMHDFHKMLAIWGDNETKSLLEVRDNRDNNKKKKLVCFNRP